MGKYREEYLNEGLQGNPWLERTIDKRALEAFKQPKYRVFVLADWNPAEMLKPHIFAEYWMNGGKKDDGSDLVFPAISPVTGDVRKERNFRSGKTFIHTHVEGCPLAGMVKKERNLLKWTDGPDHDQEPKPQADLFFAIKAREVVLEWVDQGNGVWVVKKDPKDATRPLFTVSAKDVILKLTRPMWTALIDAVIDPPENAAEVDPNNPAATQRPPLPNAPRNQIAIVLQKAKKSASGDWVMKNIQYVVSYWAKVVITPNLVPKLEDPLPKFEEVFVPITTAEIEQLRRRHAGEDAAQPPEVEGEDAPAPAPASAHGPDDIPF